MGENKMKTIKVKDKKLTKKIEDVLEKINANTLTIESLSVANLRHKKNMWSLISDKYKETKDKECSMHGDTAKNSLEITVFKDTLERLEFERERKA